MAFISQDNTTKGANSGQGGFTRTIAQDIDLIKRNGLTKVIISPIVDNKYVQGVNGTGTSNSSSNDNTTIEAWINGDIDISGSSGWESAWQEAGAASITRTFSSAYSTLSSRRTPTISLQFRQQTVKSWTGSSPLSLCFDMYFVATSADHDVRQDLARMLNLVYPVASDTDNYIVLAPLGHNAAMAENKNAGLSSIKIGDWFNSDPYFLCDRVSGAVSVKPTKSRYPLYCKVRTEFSPSQIVTIKEIRKWLGQEAGTPVTNLSISDIGGMITSEAYDLGMSALGQTGKWLMGEGNAVTSPDSPLVGSGQVSGQPLNNIGNSGIGGASLMNLSPEQSAINTVLSGRGLSI